MTHAVTTPNPPPVERFLQDVFSESWAAFKADALLYVLASLLAGVCSVLTLGILAGPLTVGLLRIVRARRRGQPAEVGAIFEGLSELGAAAGCVLLIALGVLVGSLLLIVPGLLVAVFLSFSLHELAYRNHGIGAALSNSFNLVKGAFLHTLLLLIAAGVLCALGGVVMFGTLVTGPFATVLLTVGYEKLSAQTP